MKESNLRFHDVNVAFWTIELIALVGFITLSQPVFSCIKQEISIHTFHHAGIFCITGSPQKTSTARSMPLIFSWTASVNYTVCFCIYQAKGTGHVAPGRHCAISGLTFNYFTRPISKLRAFVPQDQRLI